jgi:hypothetical protein
MHQIGQPIHARFLAIDEGRQMLFLIDTDQPQPAWSLDLKELPLARSMQRLGADRALVGFDRGFFELDMTTGKVLRVVDRWSHVTSVWREGEATLVTGTELEGIPGVVVLRVDGEGRVFGHASRPGDYVRLMQPGDHGTYLLCTNDHILETSSDLQGLRRFAAEGFLHAWKAERLPDGSTLVSAGYGAFMARFSADGSLAGTFGRAQDLPPEIAPFFYATFQLRADGRLLVANWQGHGPDQGAKGRQLVEFTAEGRFHGSWSAPDVISSLQGLLLLEALPA